MMATIVKQQIPVLTSASAENGSGDIHLKTSDVEANIFQHFRTRHDLCPASTNKSAVEAILRLEVEKHERQYLRTETRLHAHHSRSLRRNEHSMKTGLGR